jgi:phage tail-like protein
MVGLGPVGGVVGKAAEFLFGEVGMTHRFQVSIDHANYDLGDWAKVSGLSVTWTRAEYRAGNSNQVWLAPGNASYKNVELSRAACSDSQTVQNWLNATTLNNQALSGTITMLDFIGSTVVEWKLKQFFPIGWSIVEFDASGARAAVETLTLAHTGFLDDEITYA